MAKTSLVCHFLLLVFCVSVTFQASLDSERSFDTVEHHTEEERAAERREAEVPSEDTEERSIDREERASKGCGYHCPLGTVTIF